MKIKERPSAEAETDLCGQLWVQTGDPGLLYFTNEDGTDIQITTASGLSGTGVEHKIEGTNFTNSLIIGHSTTGTLDNALRNTAVGIGTMDAITTGDDNICIGYNAGTSNTIANKTVIIGSEACSSNMIGVSSGSTGDCDGTIAIGYKALHALQYARSNIAIGYNALLGCVGGSSNVYLGGSNIAIGENALKTETGTDHGYKNIAIGRESLEMQLGGNDNVALGYQAGDDITNGTKNILIGNAAGTSITTGDDNICIGYNADSSTSAYSSNKSIAIGRDAEYRASNCIAIGYATIVTGQYGIAIGDSITAVTNVFSFGSNSSGKATSSTFTTSGSCTFTFSSDRRKKQNIKDETLGLDFIKSLRPRTFQWKPRNELPKEWEDYSPINTYNTKKVHHGFIAQEVKEVLDKFGVADELDVWSQDRDGMQRVGETKLITQVIKAVQELDIKCEEQKKRIEEQQKIIEKQQRMIEELITSII